MDQSRRQLLRTIGLATLILKATPALAGIAPEIPSRGLLTRATAALLKHAGVIPCHDVIGVADYSKPSSARRFHLIALQSGQVSSHLVAHGYGSDPTHTGWLKSFSNIPSSKASSSGAFRTDAVYSGKHGRSIRLSGLDDTNSNALSRAIVVHPAAYVSDAMIRATGVLGRSDGCFAFAANSIDEILTCLGSGRMIYSDNLG